MCVRLGVIDFLHDQCGTALYHYSPILFVLLQGCKYSCANNAKNMCKSSCSCAKQGKACSSLCKCHGNCQNKPPSRQVWALDILHFYCYTVSQPRGIGGIGSQPQFCWVTGNVEIRLQERGGKRSLGRFGDTRDGCFSPPTVQTVTGDLQSLENCLDLLEGFLY